MIKVNRPLAHPSDEFAIQIFSNGTRANDAGFAPATILIYNLWLEFSLIKVHEIWDHGFALAPTFKSLFSG